MDEIWPEMLKALDKGCVVQYKGLEATCLLFTDDVPLALTRPLTHTQKVLSVKLLG